MEISRRSALVLAAGVGLVAVPATSAQAAYYNQYETIAGIPTAHECTAAQAFGAGTTYLYSVKIGRDDSRALIYRTNRNTGSTVIMTNGTDDSPYNSWLGHANDLAVLSIDGDYHLFVVTMSAEGAQLVKLHYSGTTYYKVGSFNVHLDGEPKAVSGISRVSQTGSTLTFFFKSGRNIYRGSAGLHDDSGTIDLTEAFDLKVAGALVDGEPVPDLEDFTNQGFLYHPSTNDLFYPLTKKNRSIVLVYRNITLDTSGTVTSDPELSFRITSSAYPELFEIESLGIADGTLYFNTNRAKSSGDGNYDGVHYFKGFTAD
ncbi:hypothetical protein [Ruania albidiflava]|uniref:hypothetical protein n=1 Tax=Ruania albidiflava TaxID=366586 RepID=UPI0023F41AC3|nr:hypothetical protein [Ruania albidiflava]